MAAAKAAESDSHDGAAAGRHGLLIADLVSSEGQLGPTLRFVAETCLQGKRPTPIPFCSVVRQSP